MSMLAEVDLLVSDNNKYGSIELVNIIDILSQAKRAHIINVRHGRSTRWKPGAVAIPAYRGRIRLIHPPLNYDLQLRHRFSAHQADSGSGAGR
jgi:hypothetical protein